MGPEDIRQLCKTLECSTRQLAEELGVPHREVMDWEVEKRFPTKRHVRRMQRLLQQGPGAFESKRRPVSPTKDVEGILRALDEPALRRLIRKWLVHPELREAVEKVAASYEDPVSGGPDSR